MKEFRGKDIDWKQYRTPRTISDFHPEEKAVVDANRIVFWLSIVLLILIVTGVI